MQIFKSLGAMLLISCLLFGCDEIQPMRQETSRDTLKLPDMKVKNNISARRIGYPITTVNTRTGARFLDQRTGAYFEPRGVNYFWIVPSGGGGYQNRFFGTADFDPDRVKTDFAELASRGYNVVRIIFDGCNDDPSCIGDPAGGLNRSYLENIVTTMHIAKENNLLLMLTSNDLPSQGGYWDIVDEGASPQFGPYRNRHYLTEPGIEAGAKYWEDLLSGLSALGAPFDALFAWSLLNEQWYDKNIPPFSLPSGLVTCANGNTYDMSIPSDKKRMAVEGMEYYINKLGGIIESYTPNKMITMGFFAPDYPNTYRPGDFRYVETEPLLHTANLDFFDFHAYPGGERLDHLAQNFGMISYSDKPVIMGEIGAFVYRYPNMDLAVDGVLRWVVESCLLGFDGWLYWGLYRSPLSDATYAFKDPGGEKLSKVLSFAKHPDFCNEGIIKPNLVIGKQVTASRYLSTEIPEYAIDGDYSTQWGAGSHPPQWIEIDFGTPQTIRDIRLTIAQYPAGNTIHEIWMENSHGTRSRVHIFNGHTDNDDMLRWNPGSSLVDVRRLRIHTTSSPSWVSWKEIEVYN